MKFSHAFTQHNIALQYAAFSFNDDYYWKMAHFVGSAALKKFGKKVLPNTLQVCDIGAGIGISSLELLDLIKPKKLYALEQSEDMIGMLERVLLPHPNAVVVQGTAQESAIVLENAGIKKNLDIITCCHMLHLLHPSVETSTIPIACREFKKVLRSGGIVSFDFGPSHYDFETSLANYRTGDTSSGTLIEFSHPLFQRFERLLHARVKEKIDVGKTLWPERKAVLNKKIIEKYFTEAGFKNITSEEILVPLTGQNVLNILTNSWAVLFRWAPPEFTMDERFALMRLALTDLYADKNFEKMKNEVTVYHPTVVFTAEAL